MAEVMTPIRSVDGFFREFAIEAIGKKNADRELVKEQLLDAFQKEIFGQIVDKFGDPNLLAKYEDEIDPETKRTVDNILKNSQQKWKKLVARFGKFRETANLIYDGDLMSSMDDIVKIQMRGPVDKTNDDIEEEKENG